MDKITISVIGNKEVGKTTFTTRFCCPSYDPIYDPPQTEASYKMSCKIDDEILYLEIFDSCCYHKWNREAQKVEYEKTQGFILIYSITDRDSFNDLENYLNEIYKYKKVNDFPIIIIGNKNDLEDQRTGNRTPTTNMESLYTTTVLSMLFNLNYFFFLIFYF
ncbi:ras-like family 11 member a [Anaeramoeba ignava]|uniref:Ras-like family 11 member a n=1 Tax=Anaeramoeba ignava TaxID=1746090 RepID=A0A9Q0LK82_ANAIG|nr:ras-like family 11 member a [Anaeramoeba ignava]